MDKNETIEFILSVMPNVDKIIKFADDKDIENLEKQAKQKMKLDLIEACYG